MFRITDYNWSSVAEPGRGRYKVKGRLKQILWLHLQMKDDYQRCNYHCQTTSLGSFSDPPPKKKTKILLPPLLSGLLAGTNHTLYLIVFWTSWSVSRSTAAVASSRRSSLDERSRARPRHNSCRWPTEKFSPLSCTSCPTNINTYNQMWHLLVIRVNKPVIRVIRNIRPRAVLRTVFDRLRVLFSPAPIPIPDPEKIHLFLIISF